MASPNHTPVPSLRGNPDFAAPARRAGRGLQEAPNPRAHFFSHGGLETAAGIIRVLEF